MIARLADRGEQTIAKLADLPGGTKALKAVNDLRERVDELGKKVFDLCDGRTIDDVVKDACSLAVEGQPLVSPPDIVSFLCSLKKRHLVVMY